MNKLKKGKYYIGDPCYIFGESWSNVLADTDFFNSGGVVKLFGKECIVGATAYGDGTYTDNFERNYNVDAGLIGALPVSLISIDKKRTVKEIAKHNGMHIVEFKDDFEVSISGGIFIFGDIKIDTANDDDDDDDDEPQWGGDDEWDEEDWDIDEE